MADEGVPMRKAGGVKYWSSAATVANVWRTTGAAEKLRATASRLCDDATMRQHFRAIPGRPLKGRWGRVDAIEPVL
eukprot:900909-Pyramimonas_sp.AAC.1